MTNTLWGSFNLAVGLLLVGYSPVGFGFNLGFLLFLVGFVGIGAPMASHFAKVKGS